MANAEKTIVIATQALGTWTGQPRGVGVDPADQTLPEDMKSIPSVDMYVQTALADRPEFAQLREGIEARRRLVEVERKQGCSSSGSWATLPTRTIATGSRTPT